MISFDDLINNTGTNNDEIKSSLISVQINTVLNRESIYSLSSNTLDLYNSITNMTSSTSSTQSINIDYYSPFSVLYNSGYNNMYNVSDAFNSTSISGDFITDSQLTAKGVLNFSSDNITSLCLNAEGINFNNNTLNSEYFSKPLTLNYDNLNSNVFSKGNALIMTGASADSNSFEGFNMFIKDGLFEAKHNTYSSISSLKAVDKDSFNANVLDKIAYANIEATAQQANHYTSIGIGNFSAISNLQHSIISCDKMNMCALDDILQTVKYNSCVNYNDNLFSSNDIQLNTFVNVDGLNLSNNQISYNTDVYLTGAILSVNTISYNSLVNIVGETLTKNSITNNTYLKLCDYGLTSNTLGAYMIDATAISWSRNTFGPYMGHIKAYSIYDANSHPNYANCFNGGKFLTLDVIYAKQTKFNTFDHITCKISNASSCYFTACKFNEFQGYYSQNTFTKATDFKYIGTVFDNNELHDMINVKNTIINHSWNLYDKIMNLEVDDILIVKGNTYKNIKNFTHNYYSNNLLYSQNSYESISKLFINDSIIFDSSLSNTFNSVSSVYFKFNDCVYDSNNSYTFSHSDIDSNNIYVDNIPVSWVNSWFNMSGGGGSGDYLESYSAHSDLNYMYNINDDLSNQTFNNNLYSAGPNFNWNNITVSQNIYLNMEGYSFKNNSITAYNKLLNFKYNYFDNNTFSNVKNLNITAHNIMGGNNMMATFINGSINTLSNNSFSINSVLNITAYENVKNQFNDCRNINLLNYNCASNTFSGNSIINGNIEFFEYNLFKYRNTQGLCNYDFKCLAFNYNTMSRLTHCKLNVDVHSLISNSFNAFDSITLKALNITSLRMWEDENGIYDNHNVSIDAYNINSMVVSGAKKMWLKANNMSNIFLLGFSNDMSLYLTTTYNFISTILGSQKLLDFDFSSNIYYANIHHFDFDNCDYLLDAFGGYSYTQIPSTDVYINGIPFGRIFTA